MFANGIAAETRPNELEGIAKGSPEASMLESLNEISQSLP